MIRECYDLVMDDTKNPFKHLPKTTSFQLMITLSYMWCVMFSLGIGSFFILGTSVILHTLILAGLFFTADLFNKANKASGAADHRTKFRDQDGCARYDDMWGGT